MEKVKVSELIPHPRNNEFFDDIKGDGWDDFLKSIRTSGVTNAITVDQRNFIISGHQRVRACELLGIEEIPANRVSYTEEELNAEYPKDVKDLIESNLKQRVAGNANAVKLGRCFVFLEAYYGIRRGRPSKISNNVGNLKEDSTNGGKRSQDDLIRELGLNKETYRQAKMLSSLPPEVQQAVEDGQISASTAVRTISKLPKEEQRRIADRLIGGERRFTESEVRQLIKEHQTQENQKLEKTIRELQNQPPKVETVVKNVVPSDYEEAKAKAKNYDKDRAKWQSDYTNLANQRNKLQSDYDDLKRQTEEAKHGRDIRENAFSFMSRCNEFIGEVSKFTYVADYFDQLGENEKTGFYRAVKQVWNWSRAIMNTLENERNKCLDE